MKKKTTKKALWRTNAYFITLGAGNFETMKDGCRIADNMIRAIRGWVDRYEYSVEIAAFISEDKAEYKKDELPDDTGITLVDPHLHIIVMAHPGETIAQKIKHYLETAVGRPNCVNVQKIYYPELLVRYIRFEYYRSFARDNNGLKVFEACNKSKEKWRYLDIVDDIMNLVYGFPIEEKSMNKDKFFDDFWGCFSSGKRSNSDIIDLSWFGSA